MSHRKRRRRAEQPRWEIRPSRLFRMPSEISFHEVAGGDLIYHGSFKTAVQEAYPEARITDASDSVHDSRFAVDHLTVTVAEWYRFLLRVGAVEVSLRFQLDKAQHPESLLRWLQSERGGH